MKNDEVPDLALRTKQFSLRIIKLYAALPNSAPARVLGQQLLRSGTSIGANYREARRARSKVEFLAKIGDCLKEADETHYWLELFIESALIPPEKLTSLKDEAYQLTAIFSSIKATTKKNLNSKLKNQK
jgi:four helix bundle protein